MPKSATHWLFDQLRYHPDFWLPSIKEFRYLSHARPRLDNVLQRHAQYADPVRRRAAERADVAFIEEAAGLAGEPRDYERYAALFRFKGERFSGDISPGYYRMSAKDIRAVPARFPSAKILLLVRDPVARAWSHISLLSREGQFDASLLDDPQKFAAWFETSPARKASFATEVMPRWKANAPQASFRYHLFDDIEREPARVRRDILEFLGADPKRKSGKLAPQFNRKKTQTRLELTEPIKAVLIERLAGEMRASANMFGGAAQEWPARYGL